MKIKEIRTSENSKATELYALTDCGRIFSREIGYNIDGAIISDWVDLTIDLPTE